MPRATDPGTVLDPTDLLGQVAADILTRHRGLLLELGITAVDGGTVLYGRARSFYGKQVALHEARRADLTVVANRIVVG